MFWCCAGVEGSDVQGRDFETSSGVEKRGVEWRTNVQITSQGLLHDRLAPMVAGSFFSREARFARQKVRNLFHSRFSILPALERLGQTADLHINFPHNFEPASRRILLLVAAGTTSLTASVI